MKIPLAYNLRNLVVRKTTTLMTVAGIALTVAVLVSSLALVEGLRATFANTGNPLQILVLRKGSNSELGSLVSLENRSHLLRTMRGIARNSSNQPMASLEMTQVINLPSVDDPKGMNVTLRGLLPAGIAMRSVHLASGPVVSGRATGDRGRQVDCAALSGCAVRSSSSLWPRRLADRRASWMAGSRR